MPPGGCRRPFTLDLSSDFALVSMLARTRAARRRRPRWTRLASRAGRWASATALVPFRHTEHVRPLYRVGSYGAARESRREGRAHRWTRQATEGHFEKGRAHRTRTGRRVMQGSTVPSAWTGAGNGLLGAKGYPSGCTPLPPGWTGDAFYYCALSLSRVRFSGQSRGHDMSKRIERNRWSMPGLRSAGAAG